jgi:hypothetical protein
VGLTNIKMLIIIKNPEIIIDIGFIIRLLLVLCLTAKYIKKILPIPFRTIAKGIIRLSPCGATGKRIAKIISPIVRHCIKYKIFILYVERCG